MAVKSLWGEGIKLMVDGPVAVVGLAIGPGRFDSVSESLAIVLQSGKVQGHVLSPSQLDWLKEKAAGLAA